jgi:hypothetical protein
MAPTADSQRDRRLRLLVTAGAALVAAVGFGIPWEASRALLLPDPAPGLDPRSVMNPAQASRFDRFPLYWAGPRVDGLDLRWISAGYSSERVVPPNGPVQFTYDDLHDCRAVSRDGEGAICAGRAIHVITEIRCRFGGRFGFHPRPARLRGVPGMFRPGALELFTGRVTVTIQASDQNEARRVARALRTVNGPVEVGDRLPAPAPGHPGIRGAPCSARR